MRRGGTLPTLHPVTAQFPSNRPRRRRRSEALRALVRENDLRVEHLIQPIFACHGRNVAREVPSMPGVFNLSVDERLDAEIDRLVELGIPAVILFGLPAGKDPVGLENFAPDGIVQQALTAARDRSAELGKQRS